MASEGKTGGARHVVRIGVFIPTDCQVLDAAAVDIMGSLSYEYMSMVASLVPQSFLDLAPSVDIRYIGTVPAGQPIQLTANQGLVSTNHYSDADVAPGKLDIVMIPGPDPFKVLEKKSLEWLKKHSETPGVDILSICSGILVCGEAGLLKGKTACGPRGMQDMIRAKGFGEKELVGDKLRWIQDGNFWSSGGVTHGNDLVAAYCRASHHFPTPLVDVVCEMIGVGDRAQAYNKEMIAFEIPGGAA
ncbi:ThiJ/PfpI family protein [Annulohypoxylon maeteangense]|uniref:ThiJ/PfpI family protein n=1 Tax=Annulohypoxylon maeteangense TaxID=1927788 RepID=UPI002007E9CF|nr:ThiJ/PfpI family protein [Annulohypoxylon maeteangense]KAI0890607.1 ThiJ/PfpI family protein [Annulohypoxylon maeteangense]